LYLDAAVDNLRTSGASGDLTPDETLIRLLSGTGLKYHYVGENVISLVLSASGEHSARHVTASPSIAPAKQSPKQKHAHLSEANTRATDAQVKSTDPPITDSNSRGGVTNYTLHEVVVTAQLYSQSAFNVPISLSVLTADDLTALRTFDLSNLQYQVPGVYVQTGAGLNRITIDGVGNGIGSGAVVGEYIDDADVTAEGNTGSAGVGTGDVNLYDVSRVEVLHGPQGTLYGDGSMGGVIRVITNKPDLDLLEFGSDVATAFSQYGAPSQDIQAMLNLPVASGRLGVRFAGTFDHDGGWIDEPEANAKNVNSNNLTDFRAEALWRPSSDVTLNATQIIRRDAFGIGYGEDSQGDIAAPLPFGLTTTPQAETAFNFSNVAVDWTLPGVRLLSSSTYFTRSVNWNNLFITPEISNSISEYAIYRNQAYTDTDYSEELRLSRSTQDRWQWMIGGFYKHYSDTEYQNASLKYSTPAPPQINLTFAGLDTGSKATAAFMNTSYSFTRRLELGAGVRYYATHETYNEPVYNYHGYLGLGVIPGKFEQGDFTSTDPRAYVRYGLTRHVNTYVTVAKGFREGGFNGPGLPNYQPETLWRYDGGVKGEFLNNALQSSLDLFYSDYSKYVVEGFFPLVNNYYSANAGTAHIKGVNVDVDWQMSNNWRFGVNGEYVDSQFVSIDAADTAFKVGDRVPLVTNYSLSASIQRELHLRGRPGYAVLSYSEVSGVQNRTTGFVPLSESSVIRFLNFNSSIAVSEKISLGVFARNLLNDRGYLTAFWPAGDGIRPRPRTVGVDFKVKL
jgi:iron complex outermembrane recepter protein